MPRISHCNCCPRNRYRKFILKLHLHKIYHLKLLHKREICLSTQLKLSLKLDLLFFSSRKEGRERERDKILDIASKELKPSHLYVVNLQ